MVPFILGAREHHNVASAAVYRQKQAEAIALKVRRGARYQIHTIADPIVAYVSAGTWVVSCACGAGNATDPEWGVAYCFACGAQYDHVVFPAEWAALETALLERPEPAMRHWLPGESVAEIETQTAMMARGGA